MKNLLYKLCLFNLLVIFRVDVHAQTNLPPVYEIKTDTIPEQLFGDMYYQILKDKDGRWTVEEVSSQPLVNKFAAKSKNNKVDLSVRTFWFRYRLKNAMNKPIKIDLHTVGGKIDFYVFKMVGNPEHFLTGWDMAWNKKDGYKNINAVPITLSQGEEITVYCRLYNLKALHIEEYFVIGFFTEKFIEQQYKESDFIPLSNIHYSFFLGIFLLAAFFNFFFFLVSREKVYLYLSVWLFYLSLANPLIYDILGREHPDLISNIQPLTWVWGFFFFIFIRYYFQTFRHAPRWDKVLISISVFFLVFSMFRGYSSILFSSLNEQVRFINDIFVDGLLACFLLITLWKSRQYKGLIKSFLYAVSPLFILITVYWIRNLLSYVLNVQMPAFDKWSEYWGDIPLHFTLTWAVLFFSWALFQRYQQQKKEIANQALNAERFAKEKVIERSQFIEQQKNELEKTVDERTAELKQSLHELKSTQSQLIQSEKMASLGELTAGIAHEIQNPLNFVNNFSEVNRELLVELKDEADKGNIDEVKAIANDVIDNEEKINHHGKRADAIVKGMLQHSKASTGKKELTDINKLADEYLRLSYHGMRAKDKNFNADFKTDFDESIGKINVIPQDFGRVLLNLYNNAFYATNQKQKDLTGFSNLSGQHYVPAVTVATKKLNDKVEIKVEDNGNGIPQNIVDKIFQPFFTTKPTGQGTGLGLSLAYDIITKEHNGTIKVESKQGEGSTFNINLPVV